MTTELLRTLQVNAVPVDKQIVYQSISEYVKYREVYGFVTCDVRNRTVVQSLFV